MAHFKKKDLYRHIKITITECFEGDHRPSTLEEVH